MKLLYRGQTVSAGGNQQDLLCMGIPRCRIAGNCRTEEGQEAASGDSEKNIN